jgi:NifU-like protein involved in Fe-S cluster formation/DNA-binding transcriptional regulator WhiA
MYSDKVIEHFTHPRNVGKIDDADGIGHVGNPMCLPPTEMIQTNDENKEIQNITCDDKVLGDNGLYNKVLKKFSRNYNGKILIIQNKLGRTRLTPEHIVLAIKIPYQDKYFRNKGKKTLVPNWYHADELKKRDIILYPILKETKDQKFLLINIPKEKYDFKSNKIPSKIPLNSDFLRLCGYFLSEGNIQSKPCKTYISFTLNIKEKKIVKDIRNIVKKCFGLKIKIKKNKKHNTVTVLLYSAILARLFKSLFGNYADKKKIPQFMMLLPPKKQVALIRGMWLGDGYINLRREIPKAGYSTISYQLAQQIKVLLLRQGITPSFYIEKPKIKNEVRHKKAYRIHIGDKGSLKKMANILGIRFRYDQNKRNRIYSWFKDNYLFTPIKSIKKVLYKGKVFNLEVENTHSFTTSALCVHNCGDIMDLYIKVKDNKIIDAKFQTYGCAAAIATSSMVTELVKGKTIEEALKITNQTVTEALGGVPPQKRHCSVLAEQALKAAIEDYLKRKATKTGA